MSSDEYRIHFITDSLTFWFKPDSPFSLFEVTTFIGSSHNVNHTVLALAPYRLGLAVSASPRGSAYGFPWVLFRQLHTMGLLPVRMCRWALVDEHQVLFQGRTVSLIQQLMRLHVARSRHRWGQSQSIRGTSRGTRGEWSQDAGIQPIRRFSDLVAGAIG